MSLTCVATLRAHTGPVWAVSWSSRGLLATCGADRNVYVWTKSPEGEWVRVAASPADTFLRTVRDVAWSADGRSLSIASFDASATVLQLIGGSQPKLDPVVCLEGHDAEVKGVAYSSGGGLLATCSRDRSVWIWEVGLDFDYECVAVLNSHRGDVKRVAWHPNVEMLVSCSFDHSIRVWVEDSDDWFCSEELMAHSATVWDVCFDPSGDALASVSDDGSLVISRREAPPPTVIGAHPRFFVAARTEHISTEPLYAVTWCPHHQRVAIAGGDDAIHVVEKKRSRADGSEHHNKDGIDDDNEDHVSTSLTEEWQVVHCEKRAHCGDVNSIHWSSHDGNLIASGGDDGVVRIWRYDDESGSPCE